MRAGAFAEKRVIDLVNRRFASAFFSTGGPGKGHDTAAQEFVKGRTKNKWAFLCVFTTDGQCLGETEIYADKDAVFEFLQKILAEFPEMNVPTEGEKTVVDRGRRSDATPEEIAAAATIEEELGRYDDAKKNWERLLSKDQAHQRDVAHRALLRIARYRKSWKEHAAVAASFADDTAKRPDDARIDLGIERGYAWIGSEKFSDARKLLQPIAAAARGKARETEAHFLAGVACWMSGDRDWAKFHWCEIVSRFPDDRFYMRAKIAAAAEGMPYPNAEIGGFEANTGSIGTGDITRAVANAQKVAARMKPMWDAGNYTAKASSSTDSPSKSADDVAAMVRELVDGNEHARANNAIVDRLEKIGAPAVDPLIAAAKDAEFSGRGYAAWALSQVLLATGLRPKAAIDLLDELSNADLGYVTGLASSGRRVLREHDAKTPERP